MSEKKRSLCSSPDLPCIPVRPTDRELRSTPQLRS